MSNIRQQFGAAAMTLVTLVMAGVVTNLEAALPRAIYAKTQAVPAAPASQPQVAELVNRVEILRNALNFFWVAGGAVLGAYVGVAIRKIAGLNNIAVHISVSLATSLAVAPYILRNYVNGEPETCFMGGFLIAVAAWVIWEILIIIGDRLKKAARDRGWIGVKKEIWGGTGQTSVTSPPVMTPQAPPAPAPLPTKE